MGHVNANKYDKIDDVRGSVLGSVYDSVLYLSPRGRERTDISAITAAIKMYENVL